MSARRGTKLAAGLVLAAGLLAAVVRCVPAFLPPTVPVVPAADTVFTSTRAVTSLIALPDGTVWAGTAGGALRRGPDGVWRKWTRRDGLPAHEARVALTAAGEIRVILPRAAAAWRNGGWTVEPVAAASRPVEAPVSGETCRIVWRGRLLVATVSGLHFGTGKFARQIALPPSTGTHISALLARGDRIWAALFGDGLWEWSDDGEEGEWRRVVTDLPPQARETTALAANGKTLWVGTRREGVWEYDGTAWTQCLLPDEPYDHNTQALQMFRGRLFMSTLEDGLAVRTGRGWAHLAEGVLSSNAPRQMVTFGSALYVRHGNGRVDSTRDGENWTRDVCRSLPRKEVSALTTDGRRLYAAQWGGWSEYDGDQWTHRLSAAELQGLPITALYADDNGVWIGTQGRGLAQWSRAIGTLRWHDERHGLPDDWITDIKRAGENLYVGTFVGGMARWDGTRWSAAAALAGENVTALAPATNGLFIATRSGVWHQEERGRLQKLTAAHASFLDTECQALCVTEGGGLWIGARTGLFFVTRASTAVLSPHAASAPPPLL